MATELIEFMESFPTESINLIEAGICLACAGFLFFAILHDICTFLDLAFCCRRDSARCLGFHNGTINGVCRNHSCPHSRQCVYHAPRRSFQRWLFDIAEKVKQRFR